jgi:hypothetical protein
MINDKPNGKASDAAVPEGDGKGGGNLGARVDARLGTAASEAIYEEGKKRESGVGRKKRSWRIGPLFRLFFDMSHEEERSGTFEEEQARQKAKQSGRSAVIGFSVVVVVLVGAAILIKLLSDASHKPALGQGQTNQAKLQGAQLTAKLGPPIAVWNLYVGDGKTISAHVIWPFDHETRVLFQISGVTSPELSQIKLRLKEKQTFGSEFRSAIFGHGDTIPVAGVSSGGDSTFYVVEEGLPGGVTEFFRRFPSAKLEAFKAE